MKILSIKEPYWGAWSVYGWTKNVPGVGISDEVISEAMKRKMDIYLYVREDPTLYSISPHKVLELSVRFRSKKTVRRGVRVAVIPMSELTPTVICN